MGNNPVKQAFGSPGGKSKLADKIVGLMPEHKIYVEPFAGGAAVYFEKGVSPTEVLNDKDAEIAFAFKYLANMTEKQYKILQRKEWVAKEEQFNKLSKMKPKNDTDRFYRFYYLRKYSFASGGNAYSEWHDGNKMPVERLWKLHERLKNTRVHNTTAIKMIDKYDSPNTFFYLDPPYPDRAFVGSTFGKYTIQDLMVIINRLGNMKGKFLLSLSTEHLKYMPTNWQVKRMKLKRTIARKDAGWNKSFQYEIVLSNYDIGGQRVGYHKEAQILDAKTRTTRRVKKVKSKRTQRPVTQSLAGMRG